jgi:predicted permease
MNPGFNAKNVLAMSVALPQSKYPESEPFKTVQFFDELTKPLERIPGVKSVGASTAMPIADWGGWDKYFTIEEHPASRLADVPVIQYRQVTPQFTKALGIPTIEGRFFNRDDGADRPLVAVINESARRRFFPNEDPIGKRVYPNPPESTIAKMLPSPGYKWPRFTIVGVIGDIRQSGLSRPPEPELFVSYAQGTVKNNETPDNKMFFFIKADSEPLRLVSAVRSTVQSLDPEQPIADVATMEQRLTTSLVNQRFQLVLFGSFAVLALTLAAVGIYGVLSYSVRLRTNEIGIRMALGADAPGILKMVAKRGLRLGFVGILIGAVLALGLMRFMTSLLFGVQADDAGTFAGASLILMAVVAVASFVPSWRAARTDPLAVLRAE